MKWRQPLDRPAARFARAAGLVVVGLGLVMAVFFLLPLIGRVFVQAVELLVGASVWLATSIGVGVSLWQVVGTVGRAAASGLTTAAGSLAFTVLVLVGIVALYWLQRLLESGEEESPQ